MSGGKMQHIAKLLPDGEPVTFEAFYASYPKKANKKKAEQIWRKLSETKQHRAILDVPRRAAEHSTWQDRQYIPAPDVYLRNERWTDEIIPARTLEDKQAEHVDGSNLSQFWLAMKQLYGDERVKRQYGDTIPWLWKIKLDGLTKRDIARIINYLMTDPAGLPDLGKIQRIRKIGQIPNQPTLAPPRANRETALQHLAEIQRMLHA